MNRRGLPRPPASVALYRAGLPQQHDRLVMLSDDSTITACLLLTIAKLGDRLRCLISWFPVGDLATELLPLRQMNGRAHFKAPRAQQFKP